MRLAEPRLAARASEVGARDQDNWQDYDDARHSFQSVVVSAAKKFGIEPFASIQMPLLKEHTEENYRQCRSDLTHYIAQIMLGLADRERNSSVPLQDNTRQSIKTYVVHLRDAIAKTNLPDEKKAHLHKLLDDFEQELSRKRVRIVVVASIMMAILAAPGTLVGSYDAVVRITNAIMREIGEAKAADNEQRKISFELPAALSPPRPRIEHKKRPGGDLDDEIPF